MKISIITACFNSSKTIGDTLKSVAAQVHNDIEHIIIDGDSRDETIKIVRKFPHVSKIISEPDFGIYHAMNKGINLCTGQIIGILNSDDVFASRFVIGKVVDTFALQACDALYGDLNFVDQNDLKRVTRKWKAGNYKRNRWFYGWMPPHPTFFVRRKIYRKYGLFDLDFTSSADYELMLRFLYKHEITVAYLPETLVHMRLGGHSTSGLRNRMIANREDKKAWEKNNLNALPFTRYLKPIRKISQFIFR